MDIRSDHEIQLEPGDAIHNLTLDSSQGPSSPVGQAVAPRKKQRRSKQLNRTRRARIPDSDQEPEEIVENSIVSIFLLFLQKKLFG